MTPTRSRILSFFPCCLIFSGLLPSAVADWPQFRGPDGAGLVVAGKLPDQWQPSHYAWTHDLKSRDVGSPIVFGDSVYLLRSDRERSMISLVCLDLATGDQRWAKDYPQSDYHLHRRNTLASGTPVADEQNVYAAWSDGKHTWLVAVTHGGQEVWQRDFGRWQSQHGFGTSPRLVGSLVVFLSSQQAEQLRGGDEPGESHLIAVDRETGTTAWRTPLKTTRTCYGVPAVVRDTSGSPTQLIGANTGNGIFSVDPQSGKMLWSYPAFDKRCCSSPVLADGKVIATCGSGGGGNQMVAVKIPDQDDQPREAFRIRRNAPYVPTSVVLKNRVYAIDDRGIATVHDTDSGDVLVQKRVGGNFGASPIIVGRKMLIISLDGVAHVLDIDNELASLGKTDLGAPVGATPAFADGKLLLRIGETLACLPTR